jgi:hypothetical protein
MATMHDYRHLLWYIAACLTVLVIISVARLVHLW